MLIQKISETLKRRKVSSSSPSQSYSSHLVRIICKDIEDKNRDESVPPNPYDLRQHVEFAHAIAVAIWNNCPTAKWRFWAYVPDNVKKVVMDEFLYTLGDDMNEELMKLMEATLEGGYNRWCHDVEQNGAPSK
ncbi:unnamed protein product [Malus baccata var. baccata]